VNHELWSLWRCGLSRPVAVACCVAFELSRRTLQRHSTRFAKRAWGDNTLHSQTHAQTKARTRTLFHTHMQTSRSVFSPLSVRVSLSLSLSGQSLSLSHTHSHTHTRTRTPKQPAPARTLVEALSNPELMHILKLWQIRHPTDMPLCQVERSELVELAYQNEVPLRYVSSSFCLPICLICEHAPTTADLINVVVVVVCCRGRCPI